MRKSKEVKRARKLAGLEYRKGNHKEAYNMWAEAEKQHAELAALKRGATESAPPAPPA